MGIALRTLGTARPQTAILVVMAALTLTGLAQAQDAPTGANAPAKPAPEATLPVASSAPAPTGAEIVVTGSRLASRGYQAPTPVTVVDSKDIKLSGTQNLDTLLTQTPQFDGSQLTGPTANTVPGGTATLNLRGFGAQRNLVLVNGRRFTISGPDQTTDINTIPAALVKRVEVVTGGSSAVYGSDAITGVVNFILDDNFTGLELNSQNTVDQHTGTPTYNFDVTVGTNFADDKGNVTASFDYLNRGGYTAADRGGWAADTLANGCVTPASFSTTHAGTPFTVPAGSSCLAAGGRPGLVVSGSGTIPDGRFAGVPTVGSSTSSPGLDAALIAAGLGNITSRGFTFNDAGTVARAAVSPQDDYNLAPDAYLIVPEKRVLGNVFAHYNFSDALVAYTELNFSHNQVDARLAPTGVSGNFLVNVNNPYLSPQLQNVLRQLDLNEKGTTTITEGSSTLTTAPGDGLAILNVNRRLPEAGDRMAMETSNSYRYAFGFRGDLGDVSDKLLRGLHYDVYYTYSHNDETEIEHGAVSLSRFQQGLLSVNGAPPVLDIFGANLSSAAVQSIAISSTNSTEADQTVVAANLTGDLFDLPAGPIDFNVGAEYRREHAQFTPDSFLSSGDVSGFNAALPTSGSEQAREVYGELRIPILANLPFVKRLNVNAAYRYSNYDLSGVGGVSTYSVGGEYAPSSDLTIRAQYQHAIRAPNVGELFGGDTTTGPSLTDPCSSRQPASEQTAKVAATCVATGVPAAAVFGAAVQPDQFIDNVNGGNPNVGPETSNTKTAGIVLTPRFLRGLNLSADYFNIDLKGAIGALGGGAQNTLNLCYNVIQDASSPYCQAIHRDPISGQITAPSYITTTNANTGGIKTSGVDIEGSYDFRTDWGPFEGGSRFEIGTDVTWTHEFTLTPVEALPNLKNYCVGSFGQTCGQPIPEWKGSTRLTWSSGPLTLSLRHRFIGAVTVDTYLLPLRSGGTPPAKNTLTNPTIKMQNYFDISGTLNITKGIQFSAGMTNIADKNPPIVGTPAPSDNTFAATYDIEGRTMFIGLTAKF